MISFNPMSSLVKSYPRLLHFAIKTAYVVWGQDRASTLNSKNHGSYMIVYSIRSLIISNHIDILRHFEREVKPSKSSSQGCCKIGKKRGSKGRPPLGGGMRVSPQSSFFSSLGGEKRSLQQPCHHQIAYLTCSFQMYNNELSNTSSYTARKNMHQTDIIVIGGGIAGVATACYLAQYGHEAILLEQHELATEASGLNSGTIGAAGWGHTPNLLSTLSMGSLEIFKTLQLDLGYDIEFRQSGSLLA